MRKNHFNRNKWGQILGTVTNALELLDLFRRDRPLIGLSDIARLSGVNKATCFRMLSEMQSFGLVEQITNTKEYRIGPAVLRLAALREEVAPFKAVIEPILAELAEATGESVHVSLLSGERIELVHFAYSSHHGTRVMMNDADQLPFHASSSGMAILAFAPEPLRERVLSRPLERFTPGTVVDPDHLRARLADIRTNFRAESDGSFEADVNSYAVPLFNTQGACMGALAVAAPASRMDAALRAKIIAQIHPAAFKIMDRRGGMPPADMKNITL